MKVIIYGATGMLGQAALIESLEDPRVEQVLAVVRRPTGQVHEKLRELILEDFLDYSTVGPALVGYDACLFCLGVSSAGMSEDDYRRVTVGFVVAAGEALLAANPEMRMCFISGTGTDLNGRQMWARVKGEAEQAVLAMPWKSAHVFRPAAMFPRKGVRSSDRGYRVAYAMLGWSYPIMKAIAPRGVSTSDHLGRVMLNVAREGHTVTVFESSDIIAVDAPSLG